MTVPELSQQMKEEIGKVHAEIRRIYTKEEVLHELDDEIKKMNDIANKMAEIEKEMEKIEKEMAEKKRELYLSSTKIEEEKDTISSSKQEEQEKKYQKLLNKIESLKFEMEYTNAIEENAKTAKENAKTAKENAKTAKGKAETAKGKAETAKGKAETAKGKAETAAIEITRANAKSGEGEVAKTETESQQLEKLKIEAEEEAKQVEKKVKQVKEHMYKKDWDEYCMKIACLAAQRSKDPSTPVGACIGDNKSYQIVGIGYNSMPYVKGGNNDEKFKWKGSERAKINHELKYPYVVHAAVNAIASKPSESIEGCTIYLTHCPDKDCVHAVIKAKIKEVVYCMYTRHLEYEREEKDDMKVAKQILERNSVKIRKMPNVGKKLKDRIERIRSRYTGKNKDEDKWPIEPATDFITWETFFMEIALLSKERSDHPQYKVGACVVSPRKQVLAVGYNAYPEGMIHDETEDKEKDNKEESDYISHAEYKAILGISPSVEDCTLYVTKYPCYMCAKVIVQSGIREVIYDEDGGWREEGYISSRKTLTTCLGAENIKNIRSYDKN